MRGNEREGNEGRGPAPTRQIHFHRSSCGLTQPAHSVNPGRNPYVVSYLYTKRPEQTISTVVGTNRTGITQPKSLERARTNSIQVHSIQEPIRTL